MSLPGEESEVFGAGRVLELLNIGVVAILTVSRASPTIYQEEKLTSSTQTGSVQSGH